MVIVSQVRDMAPSHLVLFPLLLFSWHCIFFQEHCLELAANGILNYVKCHEFTKGCPEKHYFSNDIYKCKYPIS